MTHASQKFIDHAREHSPWLKDPDIWACAAITHIQFLLDELEVLKKETQVNPKLSSRDLINELVKKHKELGDLLRG